MPDTDASFERVIAELEQVRLAIAAQPDNTPVALTRDDALVLFEAVERMARGFEVLQRRRRL